MSEYQQQPPPPPPPPPYSPQYPPQPQKKSKVGRWIALGCGIVFVGLVAFIAFIVLVVGAAMRSSDPYKEAIRLAQTDPRATEAIGAPIEAGYFVSGSIKTDNDGGNCDIVVPVSGSKGKGKIYVTGTKERGRWSYSKIILTPETGGEIDLLNAGSTSTDPPAE